MALSAESTGRVGAATHSVDLDTLDSVRYKMRSFLVGSKSCPTVKDSSIRLDVPKAPSTGCVNLVGAATHIPAYRLFETKRYDGPLGPLGPLGPKEQSTGCLGAAAQAQCCICLNNIRKRATVVSMPICGHLYHKACLFNWVDLSKNTFCPYCRQDDF